MSSSTLKVQNFHAKNLIDNATKFAILLGLVAVIAVIGYASLETTVVSTF